MGVALRTHVCTTEGNGMLVQPISNIQLFRCLTSTSEQHSYSRHTLWVNFTADYGMKQPLYINVVRIRGCSEWLDLRNYTSIHKHLNLGSQSH